MTYETYCYIFIGAAIMTAVMLLVSLLLFIRFQIPRVIGDITGSTVKKAIRNINRHNSLPVIKENYAYQQQNKNLTEGRAIPPFQKDCADTDETEVLPDALSIQYSHAEEGEKTVLFMVSEISTEIFEVEEDITFIHTDEVII